MTAKESFIIILATAKDVKFTVDGNKVVVVTSGNDDKTTFHFNDEGVLEHTSCNC